MIYMTVYTMLKTGKFHERKLVLVLGGVPQTYYEIRVVHTQGAWNSWSPQLHLGGHFVRGRFSPPHVNSHLHA